MRARNPSFLNRALIDWALSANQGLYYFVNILNITKRGQSLAMISLFCCSRVAETVGWGRRCEQIFKDIFYLVTHQIANDFIWNVVLNSKCRGCLQIEKVIYLGHVAKKPEIEFLKAWLRVQKNFLCGGVFTAQVNCSFCLEEKGYTHPILWSIVKRRSSTFQWWSMGPAVGLMILRTVHHSRPLERRGAILVLCWK